MRISVNIATRPFADLGPDRQESAHRHGRSSGAGGAGAGKTGIYALDQKAAQARAKEHSLDAPIAQITHERQNYQSLMLEPDTAAVLAQEDNLNQLFDEKGFSWTLAMEDLETVLPGGVQVTTLEPSRDKDGHITLHLRVLGPTAGSRYRAGAEPRTFTAFYEAAHCGRNSRVGGRTEWPDGAGERFKSREL